LCSVAAVSCTGCCKGGVLLLLVRLPVGTEVLDTKKDDVVNGNIINHIPPRAIHDGCKDMLFIFRIVLEF